MSTAKRIRTTLRRTAVVLAMVMLAAMAATSLMGEYDRAALCGVIALIAFRIVDENEEPADKVTNVYVGSSRDIDEQTMQSFLRGAERARRQAGQ